MTVREVFKKVLGKRRYRQLSKPWKDHLRRMDALPTPTRRPQPSLPA